MKAAPEPSAAAIDYDALFGTNGPAWFACGLGERHVMSMGSRLAEKPRTILICQVFGFCIFVAAFFLPAVRDAGPLTSWSNIFKGWECARIATTAMFQKEHI